LTIDQRPLLLSDNGSCYISDDLKEYLQNEEILHIRGNVHHPQTQGKIERYHRSMKNVIKLDNYNGPVELRSRLAEFIDYYNNKRYHESLDNLMPVDVYLGRNQEILERRKIIKKKTMEERRKINQNGIYLYI
jgi:putative transposase